MFALKWFKNEQTQEVILFYCRSTTEGQSPWTKVPEERVPPEQYEIMANDY